MNTQEKGVSLCHPPSQAAIHISSMFKLTFSSPRVVIPNQKGQNLNCTAACQHALAEGQFQMRRGKRLNAGTSENLLHTSQRKGEQLDEFSCSPHQSFSLHYQRTAPRPLGITKTCAICGYKQRGLAQRCYTRGSGMWACTKKGPEGRKMLNGSEEKKNQVRTEVLLICH